MTSPLTDVNLRARFQTARHLQGRVRGFLKLSFTNDESSMGARQLTVFPNPPWGLRHVGPAGQSRISHRGPVTKT